MSEGAVLIVGGSSGIGLALAKQFAQNGYDLVLAARDRSRLDAAAQQVTLGTSAIMHTLTLDTTMEGAPRRLVDALDASGAKLRYVVFGSGLYDAGPAYELTGHQLRRLLENNVVGLYALLQVLLPRLQPGTGLLFVGSLAGFATVPGLAGYASSKACLHALVRALREELAMRGFNVCLLAPGPVNTDFLPRSTGTLQQLVLDLVTSSPDTVARAAYCGLKSNSPVIVPGLIWRLAWLGMHIVPASLITKSLYRLSMWARRLTSVKSQGQSD